MAPESWGEKTPVSRIDRAIKYLVDTYCSRWSIWYMRTTLRGVAFASIPIAVLCGAFFLWFMHLAISGAVFPAYWERHSDLFGFTLLMSIGLPLFLASVLVLLSLLWLLAWLGNRVALRTRFREAAIGE